MTTGSLLLLGTGASAGIPIIGCSCAVCHSIDPKNRRSRASALVRFMGRNILIDAGPDIRQQALKFGIKHLDGLMITHTHYDHVGGLEELRVYTFREKKPIACLLSPTSLLHLKKLFYYMFEEHTEDKTIPAKFNFLELVSTRGAISFLDLPVHYFTYSQPNMEVTGFRLGDLAYVTDIKNYPETVFEDLAGIKTLIISALRFTETKLQFSVDEATDFANRVGAKKTWLIHMAHDIDHTHLSSLLPANIQPAYDGLELTFEIEDSLL